MNFLISHCAWSPERRATSARLAGQLEGQHAMMVLSDRPEHAYVWARRAWLEVADSNGPCAVLNDDVLLHPDLAAICEAMVEANPNETISLHSNMPGAVDAAKAGHHWAKCYWLTGPAYILWPERARELLDYWDDLPWSYATRVNEDVVGIMHAWTNQHPIHCALPAPVIHDTLTSSTLGYDAHANRTPTVPWTTHTPEGADLTSPDYWKPTGNEPTVDNPWMPVAKMETLRRTLAEGQAVCFMCIAAPGEVGTKEVALCKRCVARCSTAAMGVQP